MGWSVSAPSITRRTDHGLPRYADAEESDVFLLSGTEDPVPVLGDDGNRVADRTTSARLDRPPVSTAHRGPVRPHRALDQRRDR
ncbi:SpvB/TcaC N-terminal domain-containing protein [Streptomyces sp. L7]